MRTPDKVHARVGKCVCVQSLLATTTTHTLVSHLQLTTSPPPPHTHTCARQNQALHDLKMMHAVTATRLQWSEKRPATYQSEMPRTAKTRIMKEICGQLV